MRICSDLPSLWSINAAVHDAYGGNRDLLSVLEDDWVTCDVVSYRHWARGALHPSSHLEPPVVISVTHFGVSECGGMKWAFRKLVVEDPIYNGREAEEIVEPKGCASLLHPRRHFHWSCRDSFVLRKELRILQFAREFFLPIPSSVSCYVVALISTSCKWGR